MNNGIFGSIRDRACRMPSGGKRPLTNMCPVIARKDGRSRFALGGSGGRKIFPAVLAVDFHVDRLRHVARAAWHTARIDASGGDQVGVDPRLSVEVLAALEREFQLNETEFVVYPTNFACPSAVMRDWRVEETAESRM